MGKRYSLMRCRHCGFPRLLSFFVKWNENGTITQMIRKDFKVVILYFGFIDSLFSHIEAKLGFPIEHIAFEAQRNASRETFKAFADRLPGARLALGLKTVRRLGAEQFNRVATITGQCFSETLEYKPGSYGVARIKNPFNLQLMAANVVGAFETLEGMPFKHRWEEESRNDYVLTIEATGEKPEIAERLGVEYPEMLPGRVRFERCPRCKAPLALSQLKWMENEGLILDTRTGVRVIMLDGFMVSSVFRELVKELGEEVNDLIVEAQREWTVDHVAQLRLDRSEKPLQPDELEAAYRRYLEMLPLYGQGNPVSFKVEDSKVSLTVENPYETHVLAGTIKGLYEALEKNPGRVTFEKESPQSVSYIVEPA